MDEQPKLKRLRKLVASEVSLVNRGAVRRPFLIVKNKDGTVPDNAQRDLFAITPEQDKKLDAVIAKRAQPVAKDLGDEAAGPTDGAPDETAPDTTDDGIDDNMPDERSMAALKAVYRILLPFKGQISEDMVDDVLAELDLDDTGEDGQDDVETADDADVEGETDDINEEDTAMAKGDGMPDELKDKLEKGASWTPAQPEGMSDEDYNKAVAAAKAAFSGACSKDAGDDEDEDEDDKDVKKNVSKSALPKHAELVAKAEAEKAQWIAKAADLEARLGKMETERVLKSHEDDIRRDCEILGRDPGEQARILKSAFEANEETGKAFRSLLAESARLSREGGVFKSVGTSSNASFGSYVPSTGQGSPRAQLEAMVKGLVQKGETKDEAAAWASVLNTSRGQELYAADRNGSH